MKEGRATVRPSLLEIAQRSTLIAQRSAGTVVALRRCYTFSGEHMADDLTNDGVENQIEGAGKQVEGRIRNAVGGLTGDTSEQLKGKAKDLEGKAQRKIGEAQQDLDSDT